MSKKGKWNAHCKDLFDEVRKVGRYSVEVHAWAWANNGEADVLWTAVGLLRWCVYEGPSFVPGAYKVAQGLVPFDLEQVNEATVIIEAVHKFEGLVAEYEQLFRLLAGASETSESVHEATA
jgi:hypothetical protein